MAGGRRPVHADLYRQPREIQIAQKVNILIGQEHEVGLQGYFAETAFPGKPHQIPPGGVTKRFAPGQTDALSTKSGKFPDHAMKMGRRYVAARPAFSGLDPAMDAPEIADSGDGQSKHLRRTQTGLHQFFSHFGYCH
jgi:hypothetical protein